MNFSRGKDEVVRTALVRIFAVADTGEARDIEHVEGAQAALSAAWDYALEAVDAGEEDLPPLPEQILAQARRAARRCIPLSIVLRRYLAGYTVLAEHLLDRQLGGDISLDPEGTRALLRLQAEFLDRLLDAVGTEYLDELKAASGSVDERRMRLIRGLLNGRSLDATELAYDLGGHHLAVIAGGPDAQEAVRAIAADLGRSVLIACPGEHQVWGWFGSMRPFAPSELDRIARCHRRGSNSLALGEAGEGIAGWRLTHEQAQAAWPIAVRSPEGVVRYGDVALLASMLRDNLLARSVKDRYLSRLDGARDSDDAMRDTLRAYFSCERNVSSAASSLGVSRQTVANRIRVIEERFGRPLPSCAAELDAALRLEELGYSLLPHHSIG